MRHDKTGFSIFNFIEAPVTTPVSLGKRLGRIQAEIVGMMRPECPEPATALFNAVKIKKRLIRLWSWSCRHVESNGKRDRQLSWFRLYLAFNRLFKSVVGDSTGNYRNRF